MQNDMSIKSFRLFCPLAAQVSRSEIGLGAFRFKSKSWFSPISAFFLPRKSPVSGNPRRSNIRCRDIRLFFRKSGPGSRRAKPSPSRIPSPSWLGRLIPIRSVWGAKTGAWRFCAPNNFHTLERYRAFGKFVLPNCFPCL